MRGEDPRFGGVTLTHRDDEFTWRDLFVTNFGVLFRLAARFDTALSGNRPAPSIARRLFLALDTREVSVDDGGTWTQLRPPTASAPPTTGSYARGHQVLNAAPAQGAPIGWVCTASGEPGTWRPFGTIG